MKKYINRFLSALIAVILVINMIPFMPVIAASEKTSTYSYEGYDVIYSVTDKWDNGQTIEVEVKNTGEESIMNWAFKFDAGIEIQNLWNAVIVEKEDTEYIIKNADWNYELMPKQSVKFGYTIFSDESFTPDEFELCSDREDVTDGYDVQTNITESWNDGIKGEITITNTSDNPIEAWNLSFHTNFVINDLWNAKILDRTDYDYKIASEVWSNPIQSKDSIVIGFVGQKPQEEKACVDKVVLTSVNVDRSFGIVPSDDCTKTICAFAGYDKENNSIIMKWSEAEGTGVYKIFEKSKKRHLVGKVTNKTNFTFQITEKNKSDEYIFVVEKHNSKTDILVSNDVIMRLNDENTYEFVYVDTDEDGLYDVYEIQIGSDLLKKDTDGDGLLDGYEYNTLETSPLMADTDENGVLDGEEDFDQDELSNLEEYTLKTNPFSFDTDEDGFSDKYESIHGMNPLVFDEIVFDDSIIDTIQDNTLESLESLNSNEYYPLEVDYNESNSHIKSISGTFSTVKVFSPTEAIYSLYSVKTMLGLEEPKEALKFDKSNSSKSSTSYTFVQYYKGFEVFGRTITISADKTGKVTSLHSSILSDEELMNVDLTTERKESDLKSILSENKIEGDVKSTKCYIFADETRTIPQLIYLMVIEKKETSIEENVMIDAITGEVFQRRENVAAETKMTIGKGKNENDFFVEFPVCKVDIVSFVNYYMRDQKRKICVLDRTNGDKVYESKTNTWDDKTANIAYVNIIKTYDWWSKHNYKGIDGKGGEVKVYIHDPKYDHNAFYSPSNPSIHFCDTKGSNITRASALDCAGHEYTHAVFYHKTNCTSSGGMKSQTINEAYGDIFGSFIKNAWKTYPRDTTKPTDTTNPDRVGGQYYDLYFKDDHTNATVITYAAYLMNSKYNFTFEQLIPLWYDSLMKGYDNYSDFNTVRTNVIQSARDNQFSYKEISNIRKAFDDVGIGGDKGSATITVFDGNKAVQGVTVTINNYGDTETKTTNSSGVATFKSLHVGVNTVKIELTGFDPIYTIIYVTKGNTAKRTINVLTSMTKFKWIEYDHYNYKQPYVSALPKHIVSQGNDIKMIGYTVDPLKDFMLTDEEDKNQLFVKYPNKVLSFKIKRDANDWHTMEGGGFLFNARVDNNKLYSYCILVTQNGLNLYAIPGVDILLFQSGKLGNISQIGKLLGNYDIGNVLNNHKITLNISKIWDGIMISVWDGNKLIIENKKLPDLNGNNFGPITSHISHYCSQVSYFTFSDIQMSSISTTNS